MMHKENLVLLHGWGFNRFIWDPILPELNKRFTVIALDLDWSLQENLCEWIAQNTPKKAIYLGWSLGGLIAMKMALHYPDRVEKIITVCASPYFLQSENWPGIAGEQLDYFRLQSHQDPKGWAHQFIESQLGVINPEKLDLSRFFTAPLPSPDSLDAGLSLLKNTDIRSRLLSSSHEKLCIFGRLDRVTLEKTSDALIQLGTQNLTCKTIKRAAHVPFLSHPDIFLEHVFEFCKTAIDNRKSLIKKSFNQSASTYQDVAMLQEKCGEKLLTALPADFQPNQILELGCGTGLLTRRLIEKFPNAKIIAIDIAEKMLLKANSHYLAQPSAQTRHPERSRGISSNRLGAYDGRSLGCARDDGGSHDNDSTNNADSSANNDHSADNGHLNRRRPATGSRDPSLQFICADAESLPFSNNSFDLIISNFTLQWCELPKVFHECQRLLKNKGYFYFCTLGENTLHELKTCWKKIDNHSHVNEFPSFDEVQTQLNATQLQNISITKEEIKEYYEHPMGVLSRIKAWGAHNIHQARPKGLSSKNKFTQLIKLYQSQFTNEEGVYASYQTLYGSAQKN